MGIKLCADATYLIPASEGGERLGNRSKVSSISLLHFLLADFVVTESCLRRLSLHPETANFVGIKLCGETTYRDPASKAHTERTRMTLTGEDDDPPITLNPRASRDVRTRWMEGMCSRVKSLIPRPAVCGNCLVIKTRSRPVYAFAHPRRTRCG